MSYYKDNDPRRIVWERLNQLEKEIKYLLLILDELWVELDDGKHWTTKPIILEEEE